MSGEKEDANLEEGDDGVPIGEEEYLKELGEREAKCAEMGGVWKKSKQNKGQRCFYCAFKTRKWGFETGAMAKSKRKKAAPKAASASNVVAPVLDDAQETIAAEPATVLTSPPRPPRESPPRSPHESALRSPYGSPPRLKSTPLLTSPVRSPRLEVGKAASPVLVTLPVEVKPKKKTMPSPVPLYKPIYEKLADVQRICEAIGIPVESLPDGEGRSQEELYDDCLEFIANRIENEVQDTIPNKKNYIKNLFRWIDDPRKFKECVSEVNCLTKDYKLAKKRVLQSGVTLKQLKQLKKEAKEAKLGNETKVITEIENDEPAPTIVSLSGDSLKGGRRSRNRKGSKRKCKTKRKGFFQKWF